MDIGFYNNEWFLDSEALRAVILGKVIWKRCYNCEKGVVWVDGYAGEIVSSAFVDEQSSEHETGRFYLDVCVIVVKVWGFYM